MQTQQIECRRGDDPLLRGQAATEPQPGVTSYVRQWEEYFNSNSTELKEAAMAGKLRSCHFRSVCWRVRIAVVVALCYFLLTTLFCCSYCLQRLAFLALFAVLGWFCYVLFTYL